MTPKNKYKSNNCNALMLLLFYCSMKVLCTVILHESKELQSFLKDKELSKTNFKTINSPCHMYCFITIIN